MESTRISLLELLCEQADQSAWPRFVSIYTPLICYWGRRAGLSEDDAVDLTQDVLLLLLRKLPEFQYDKSKSFRGWLRTVTMNKWRERHRRTNSAPQCVLNPGDAPEVPDTLEEFWEHEYHQHVAARALAFVKQEFQESTWKACWEVVMNDRPAKEVGAELGMTAGAVYVAKCRVLRRLRSELDGILE